MRIGLGEFYRPDDIVPDDEIRFFSRLQFIEAIYKMPSLNKPLKSELFPLYEGMIKDARLLEINGKATIIPEEWSAEDALCSIITWGAILDHLGMKKINANSISEIHGYLSDLDVFLNSLDGVGKNDWDFLVSHLAKSIWKWSGSFDLVDRYWVCRSIIMFFFIKANKANKRLTLAFLPDGKELFEPTKSTVSDRIDYSRISDFLLVVC